MSESNISTFSSLDMESIDALAKAVNEFDGGMVLVSHDMRLISQVAKEIWICDNKTITVYKGDIQNFKLDMRAQMGIEGEQKSQLRGDASVAKKDSEQKKAPSETRKPEPILEIVAPKKQVPAPEPKKDVFDTRPIKDALPPTQASNRVSVVTTEPTTVQIPTVVPIAAGAAPTRAKYVPPHLRNK
jgi:ABC-type multidrug transport system ATPase subunit